ncbi:hypothetical protein AWB77_00466 [Caballeronia fortuita]|uniref:Uncharacterized protein n=1 Tax=Caballeronia fortuita TaxID=1777138 RepID=A0A157ZCD1_9BURK|nr:hypothetical protein [Caballeronia fortuita]SAK42557.1 hypothetical protein AWB77_00466 [Caballeronia fortuita]
MGADISKLVSKPLSQDFSPTEVIFTGLDRVPDAPNRIAIYVEPRLATGLNELLPHVRSMLLQERGTGSCRHAALTGKGLTKAHAPRAWVDDMRESDEFEPDFLAGLQYRLHVVDALRPVGYCCFKLLVSGWTGFGVELDEAWLKPAYRGLGLGMILSRRVADLATFSLRELESRVSQQALQQSLDISVSGDVYSESGERFVPNVAESLVFSLNEHTWSALTLSDVEAAPHW